MCAGGRSGPWDSGPLDHGRPHEDDGPHGPDPRHGRGGPFGRGGPRGSWELGAGPVARARLLAALAEGRLMSVTELAEAIGVDQPRASRLVQSAVGEGLVVREADPDDARRTRLRITDEGRAAVHAATSNRRRAIESALDGFSDDERERFADLLGRFAAGLRRAHPPHR
jgi:DNA-binding MarR family transcriptional regulator